MWFGGGENWLLLGIRDGHRTVTAAEFRRQWSDRRYESLVESGFEKPEQLGSYFICDREGMLDLANGCEPVEDNYPHRISSYSRSPVIESRYSEFLNAEMSARIFQNSDHIRKLWPDTIRQASAEYFQTRNLIHDLQATEIAAVSNYRHGSVAALHRLLVDSDLSTPVLWSLGSSLRKLKIVDGVRKMKPDHVMVLLNEGHRRMAARNYVAAAEQYSRALARFEGRSRQAPQWIVSRLALAQCLSGRVDNARRSIAELDGVARVEEVDEDLKYLSVTFDLQGQASGPVSDRKLSVQEPGRSRGTGAAVHVAN